MNQGPEIRIYNTSQLQEIASESGYSIAEIKGHIDRASANGSNVVSYLTPTSWRRIWEDK